MVILLKISNAFPLLEIGEREAEIDDLAPPQKHTEYGFCGDGRELAASPFDLIIAK